MISNNEIHIAVAIIRSPDGKVLLVRKRNSTAFIQPGGKIQADEDAVEAWCRELWEELQLRIQANQLIYTGTYSAPAINEPGYIVIAEVFRLELEDIVHHSPQK